jgi:hypothetical protein
VRSTRPALSTAVAALVLAASVVVSAENQQKAFESSWVRRHVIVKRTLYSLVYKEQRIRGSVEVKRDGLTVVTPFAGTYFQFDGRRHVDDIMEQDVVKISESVRVAYMQSKLLDEGFSQVVDPVLLTRYDPGTELIVRTARVNRETVRLELAQVTDGDKDIATSLTVQWPAPLSKSFTERVNVEGLIQQFLTIRE